MRGFDLYWYDFTQLLSAAPGTREDVRDLLQQGYSVTLPKTSYEVLWDRLAKTLMRPIAERVVSRSHSGKPGPNSYYDYISKSMYYVDPDAMPKWIEKLSKTNNNLETVSSHRSAQTIYLEELLDPLNYYTPKWKKYYDHAWDVALRRTSLTSDQLLKDR